MLFRLTCLQISALYHCQPLHSVSVSPLPPLCPPHVSVGWRLHIVVLVLASICKWGAAVPPNRKGGGWGHVPDTQHSSSSWCWWLFMRLSDESKMTLNISLRCISTQKHSEPVSSTCFLLSFIGIFSFFFWNWFGFLWNFHCTPLISSVIWFELWHASFWI